MSTNWTLWVMKTKVQDGGVVGVDLEELGE